MMFLKTLLIDDLRDFRESRPATIARTSAAALAVLENHRDMEWDEIWLDHDLGTLPTGEVDSIMRVVDYLCERAFNDDPVVVKTIYVHTSNPAGGRQMMTSLERYGYNVRRVQAEIYFTMLGN